MKHLSSILYRSQAFTLVELLIVMLLISIIMTYVFLNPSALKGQRTDAENFPRQLYASLQRSQIESVFNQQAIKFQVRNEFYGFQHGVTTDRFNTKWQWFDDKSALAKVELNSLNKMKYSRNNSTKDIIFFPNSEVTPFLLTVYKNSVAIATVSSDLAGEIVLDVFDER